MNNKTKGAIAGVAGVALLAGGTTFALWRDSAQLDAGTITSGNLEVQEVNPSTWMDITDGAETSINLDEFRIVPGDVIQRTFSIDVALEGDHMLATLGFALSGSPVDETTDLWPGVAFTYSILDSDNSEIGNETSPPTGLDAHEFDLRSEKATSDAAEPSEVIAVPAALDNGADFTIVVTAAFPEETGEREEGLGREFTQAKTNLENLGVTLTQVRSHG